ncbi:hypothetical protein [Hydrogenophaga sp.]|uniref:hypothetical protein n=1 Tax=Hydrogenophaga sp. TaxID=1904254 RepID=UPI0025C2A784|nr:hypothetical protein [Hydrogenophaga sp.]
MTTTLRPATGVPGVFLYSSGLDGPDGGAWQNGDPGGTPTPITVRRSGGSIVTSGQQGIAALSVGGSGGDGGGGAGANSGHGGNGAAGGAVKVVNFGDITTSGDLSNGILAASIGGDGGDGGGAYVAGSPGRGGLGSYGGEVNVALAGGTITTTGAKSAGIRAVSWGGSGGQAGSCGGLCFTSPSGGGTQAGGKVGVVTFSLSQIHTSGIGAYGVYAQSLGGRGGAGGSISQLGLFGYGTDGGGGGDGGLVDITTRGTITTTNHFAHGIYANSVGGGGGNGGDSDNLLSSLGGNGLAGGNGGEVKVTNSGAITTGGIWSRGIYAHSVGGVGGNGGDTFGLASLGGSGGGVGTTCVLAGALCWPGGAVDLGKGGQVTVDNTGNIRTTNYGANAIFAQSVGGGGGSGGMSLGLLSIGGSASGGGNGGQVTVRNNSQTLNTGLADAAAIYAQSVGGGGGQGGDSVAVGPYISLGIGGRGGAGGDGGAVDVQSGTGSITTTGDRSAAIFAQSVGGGGGDGGFAISAAAGKEFSFSVALGGDGAGGGNGGAVQVRSASSIATFADDAAGIQASSVGGGGGNGGFSIAASASLGYSFGVSIGGSGSAGGTGGAVAVGLETEQVTGTIKTYQERSAGIKAVSVGGGGGDGGFSIAAGAAKAGAFTFSLGGSAGAGGIGGAVDVFSAADITTKEISSYGILAQSVGGGGGVGGFSVAGGFSAGPTVNVSIGGAGGDGGTGGAVNVGTGVAPIAGNITTEGKGSSGIQAVSQGGTGGAGGFSVAGGMSKDSGSISFSKGGTGGNGATSGEVWVVSEAVINTRGTDASGIFAQSLAGNGGNGGFSVAGGLTSKGGINASFGGDGGAGAQAALVLVSNRGTITTAGQNAKGIDASSIGGNGGNGGFSVAGGLSFSGAAKNIEASFGGGGGDGGLGAQVLVLNNGVISTTGEDASAIHAQSIGGNGGSGGFSAAGALAFGSENPQDRRINLAFSLGGGGGNGNVGGAASVLNNAGLNTSGDNAHGIYAESVGGGGGSGGNSLTALIGASGTAKAQTINLSTAIGGKGGEGNNGGVVTVSSQKAVATTGYGAHGIYAQSIGGGGGDGGKANTLSMVLDQPCGFDKACKKTAKANEANNINVQVAVGGNGGGASDGNLVHVINSGTITTQRAGANGIMAESIGGGGGNGGSGTKGLGITEVDVALGVAELAGGRIGKVQDMNVQVGGNGGASGNGGEVRIQNTGALTTHGSVYVINEDEAVEQTREGGYGIFAHSVGGGGGYAIIDGLLVASGNGGAANSGATGKVGVGGAAGSAGNGGTVTVATSGAITTSGSGAHAVWAESVGGGGGVAGNVNRLAIPVALGEVLPSALSETTFGLGLGFGRGGGNGGNGGDVAVVSGSAITTHGLGAYGIFAHSVGGGGGAAGDPGNFGISKVFYGSTGGLGSAGVVDVQQTGDITTSGAIAHGIVAQSAAGTAGSMVKKVWVDFNPFDAPNSGGFFDTGLTHDFNGKGGAVNVTLNGNVTTSGLNAIGILAQSIGAESAGNITINVEGGSVNGGSGVGAGVAFMDGNNNVLTNRGSIAALSGLAVRGEVGNERVDNFELVTGSVDLGTGSNAFNNGTTGLFNSGSNVALGAGNLLRNQGTIAPGGMGVVQRTAVVGNYFQASTGVYAVDLDLASLTADSMTVTGNAQLAGAVNVGIVNRVVLQPGAHSFALVTADGGLSGNFSTANLPTATAVLSYGLDYTANAAQLQVTAQAFDAVLAPGTTSVVGGVLSGIDPASMSADLQSVLIELQSLPDAQSVGNALKTLGPEAHDSVTRATSIGLDANSSQLSSRLGGLRTSRSGATRSADAFVPVVLAATGDVNSLMDGASKAVAPRHGLWLEPFGKTGTQADEAGGFTGFKLRSNGLTVGYDQALGEHSVVGAAFGYARTRLDFNGQSARGEIGNHALSLYGSWDKDGQYVQGILSYGNVKYEQSRTVIVGGISRVAVSQHSGKTVAADLEAGFMSPSGNWSRGPYAAARLASIREEAFSETGAGGLSLLMAGKNTDTLNAELGFRAEHASAAGNGDLVVGLTAAWLHDFAIDDRTLSASYDGALGNAFAIPGLPAARNGAKLGASLSYVDQAGWMAALRYQFEVREGFRSHGLAGEMRLSF